MPQPIPPAGNPVRVGAEQDAQIARQAGDVVAGEFNLVRLTADCREAQHDAHPVRLAER